MSLNSERPQLKSTPSGKSKSYYVDDATIPTLHNVSEYIDRLHRFGVYLRNNQFREERDWSLQGQ